MKARFASRATLTKVLTYHVVAGKMDAATLGKAIMAGGGKLFVEMSHRQAK